MALKEAALALAFLLIAANCLCGVKSQSAPCTTPSRTEGLCVPIQHCKNIHNIVTSPTPPSRGVQNYITRAACTLPNVERSICCQPVEVSQPAPTTVVTPGRPSNLHLLPTKKCGTLTHNRISFGNLTRVFDYPWMALLQYRYNGRLVDGCGGSLINNRYVLTAAHCVKTRSTFQLAKIRLGEHTKGNVTDCNIYPDGEEECADPVVDVDIESTIVHPKYNQPAKFQNDVALIRLAQAVDIEADHIKPICLPVSDNLRSKVLDKYIITGWGTTEDGSTSDALLYAIVPRVDIPTCQARMAENNLRVTLSEETQMCAGGEDKVDSCKGDSGGPLGSSVDNNGGAKFVQFGIVSAGVNSCGQKSVPGLYAKVASYMTWIGENIEP